jgi:beta-lactamase superfamily II metal-dependent hydrolase
LIPVAYRNRKLVRPTIAICIVGASVLLIQPISETLHSPEITILATRNGDATVIRAPHGKNILVASFGGYREEDVINYTIAPYLWSQGITRLDTIVVSRFGAAGWPNLAEFCNKFRVWEVHLTNCEKNNKEYAEALNLSVIFHEKSWILHYGGMKLKCVCGLMQEDYQSEVATTVEYQGERILLAGALSLESEMLLAAQNWPHNSVDTFVIPRYGKTMLCYETISRVHPKYAIVNGTVSNDLLRKQLKSIQILETEKAGAVTISFSSGNITVTTALSLQGRSKATDEAISNQ